MEDNKPIKINELISYMNDKFGCIDETYPSDKFAQLLLDGMIREAITVLHIYNGVKFDTTKMLIQQEDIMKEFFRDNAEYNDKGYYTCHNYFISFVINICRIADHIDLVKLIQFLVPKNMIGEHLSCKKCVDSYKYNESCGLLTHDYEDYCRWCIHDKNINNARAIYIMFPVDNLKLLKYFYLNDNLDQLKIAYDIILQTQDIIPLCRRGIPTLDIVQFVESNVSFDIMEWYHNINPQSYTTDKINEVLRLVKIKTYEQTLSKFEKFLKHVDITNRMKQIYNELDDKPDIFKELKNKCISDSDIGDNYICYSRTSGEYGVDVEICDLDGTCIYRLFVSGPIDDTDNIYITTFYNNITQKGIHEKIMSNRTEHYIDNVYHSRNFNDEIMDIVKANTKMIMCDKKYPKLYEFITSVLKSCLDDITLIPKSEFLI